MKRRDFLKSLSAIPVVAIAPALALETKPELSLDDFSDKYIKPAMEAHLDRSQQLYRFGESTTEYVGQDDFEQIYRKGMDVFRKQCAERWKA